ncbi:hypothetical protein CAOG_05347 [Capsaspora owczarzaki ATCC 30864]|uniref:G-protein coupled receptors family 3 profile domain-containing protein n=1 Tax=Capsaspora owczarzaki (strain ATCC 30864) TaxID=595528 RepID=A0A0D2X3R3_CAPO3|nr:hypothetical protein CAOG_05347 [Capsaspora owczarzaki ATCC 30864]KJE94759.1 hypothetical protein CAOG_005347 [Capsaspora owczarzaki ATCC 30864]|eukprot:XP_004347032.2 hypothetical protein CAOG_05347 [Capsaspora owczarzaki ATCC 30864]
MVHTTTRCRGLRLLPGAALLLLVSLLAEVVLAPPPPSAPGTASPPASPPPSASPPNPPASNLPSSEPSSFAEPGGGSPTGPAQSGSLAASPPHSGIPSSPLPPPLDAASSSMAGPQPTASASRAAPTTGATGQQPTASPGSGDGGSSGSPVKLTIAVVIEASGVAGRRQASIAHAVNLAITHAMLGWPDGLVNATVFDFANKTDAQYEDAVFDLLQQGFLFIVGGGSTPGQRSATDQALYRFSQLVSGTNTSGSGSGSAAPPPSSSSVGGMASSPAPSSPPSGSPAPPPPSSSPPAAPGRRRQQRQQPRRREAGEAGPVLGVYTPFDIRNSRFPALVVNPFLQEGGACKLATLQFGSLPNQLLEPLVQWLGYNADILRGTDSDDASTAFYLGQADSFAFAGSTGDAFTSAVGAAIADVFAAKGAKLVAEELCADDQCSNANEMLVGITSAYGADQDDIIIVSTIDSSRSLEATRAFYTAVQALNTAAGPSGRQIIVVSLTLSEADINALPIALTKGHAIVAGYLAPTVSDAIAHLQQRSADVTSGTSASLSQSTANPSDLITDESAIFVKALHDMYGSQMPVITDVMEAAYTGTFAVLREIRGQLTKGDVSPETAIVQVLGATIYSPAGTRALGATLFASRQVYIARTQSQSPDALGRTWKLEFMDVLKYAFVGEPRNLMLLRANQQLQAASDLVLETCDAVFKKGDLFSPDTPRVRLDVARVAVVLSVSGALSVNDREVFDGVLLGLQQIQDSGGIFGYTLVPVFYNPNSSLPLVLEHAASIANMPVASGASGITTTFLGGNSAARRQVAAAFQDGDHLAWYPLFHEGQECSQSLIYTGAVPSQIVEDTVRYFVRRTRERPDLSIFLVGAGDVFSQKINAIIVSVLAEYSITVTETYVLKAAPSIHPFIQAVGASSSALIYSTVIGSASNLLYRSMSAAGLAPPVHVIVSFTLSEPEVGVIGAEHCAGHFIAASYVQPVFRSSTLAPSVSPSSTASQVFQQYIVANASVAPFFAVSDALDESSASEDGLLSDHFLELFRSMYGSTRRVSQGIESAFLSVMLWRQAVEAASSFESAAVRAKFYDTVYNAPEGLVAGQSSNHLSKQLYIGEVRADGLVDAIWTRGSKTPIVWSTYLNDSFAYSCDFLADDDETDASPVATTAAIANLSLSDGSMNDYPFVEVLLIHSLSGSDSSQTDFCALHAELLAIAEINAAGGLVLASSSGPVQILPRIFDTQSNASYSAEQLLIHLSDENVVQGFGAISAWTRSQVESAASLLPLRSAATLREIEAISEALTIPPSQKLVWTAAHDSGIFCSGTIASFGPQFGSRMLALLAFLTQSKGISYISLAFEDDALPTSITIANTTHVLDQLVAALVSAEVTQQVVITQNLLQALNCTLVGVVIYSAQDTEPSAIRQSFQALAMLHQTVDPSTRPFRFSKHSCISTISSASVISTLVLALATKPNFVGTITTVAMNLEPADVTADCAGVLVLTDYLDTTATTENSVFTSSFYKASGSDNTLSQRCAAAYTAVKYWAQSANAAASIVPSKLQLYAYAQSFHAPNGLVRLRATNRATTPVYLALVNEVGTARLQFPSSNLVAAPSLEPVMLSSLQSEIASQSSLPTKLSPDFLTTTATIWAAAANLLAETEERATCVFAAPVTSEAGDSAQQAAQAVYALAAVNLLLVALTTILITARRTDRVVMAASYLFCLVILTGIALVTIAGVVVVAPPDRDSVICSSRVWLVSFSIMLLFSALFAKTYRLHRLFNATSVRRSEGLTDVFLLKIIGIFLLCDVALLIAWTVVDRSMFAEEMDWERSTPLLVVMNTYCTSSLPFVLANVAAIGLLLVWGAYLAWRTRLLPSQFNESSQIAFAIVLILFLGVITIPLNYLIGGATSSSDDAPLVIIRGCVLVLGSMAILLILFVPKVHLILRPQLQAALANAHQAAVDKQQKKPGARVLIGRAKPSDSPADSNNPGAGPNANGGASKPNGHNTAHGADGRHSSTDGESQSSSSHTSVGINSAMFLYPYSGMDDVSSSSKTKAAKKKSASQAPTANGSEMSPETPKAPQQRFSEVQIGIQHVASASTLSAGSDATLNSTSELIPMQSLSSSSGFLTVPGSPPTTKRLSNGTHSAHSDPALSEPVSDSLRSRAHSMTSVDLALASSSAESNEYLAAS